MNVASKIKPSTSKNPSSLRIKARFSYKVIHVQETGWKLGVRSCIMPGSPKHLVQELNVCTVHAYIHCSYALPYVWIFEQGFTIPYRNVIVCNNVF